jgi:hypothetical protein
MGRCPERSRWENTEPHGGKRAARTRPRGFNVGIRALGNGPRSALRGLIPQHFPRGTFWRLKHLYQKRRLLLAKRAAVLRQGSVLRAEPGEHLYGTTRLQPLGTSEALSEEYVGTTVACMNDTAFSCLPLLNHRLSNPNNSARELSRHRDKESLAFRHSRALFCDEFSERGRDLVDSHNSNSIAVAAAGLPMRRKLA